MTNEPLFFNNYQFRRIILDEYFEADFKIGSEEFKMALKFLQFLEINYDEEVLLNIDTTPDALIALFIEFIYYYRQINFTL